MSIASFRMATSPSDENNKDILNWLDLLRSSLRTNASGAGNSGSGGGQGSSLSPGGAGGSGIGTRGPGAFGPDTMRGGNGADEDSDHESPNDNQPNHRLAELYNLKEDDNEDDSAPRDGDDDGAGGVDSADVDGLASGQGGVDEKLQQNLPEETVPLGLIANLSLDDVKASKGNRRPDGAGAQAAIDEGLDDDNVVCLFYLFNSSLQCTQSRTYRVSLTKRTSCLVGWRWSSIDENLLICPLSSRTCNGSQHSSNDD